MLHLYCVESPEQEAARIKLETEVNDAIEKVAALLEDSEKQQEKFTENYGQPNIFMGIVHAFEMDYVKGTHVPRAVK